MTGTGGVEATMAAYGYVRHRTLDPVRAAALTAAIQSYHWTAKPMVDPTPELLELADTFEAWLDPKEDDGQT